MAKDDGAENVWCSIPQPAVWRFIRGDYYITVAEDEDEEDTFDWSVMAESDEDEEGDDDYSRPHAHGSCATLEDAKKCAIAVLDIISPMKN